MPSEVLFTLQRGTRLNWMGLEKRLGLSRDTGIFLNTQCWFPGNPIPDVCIKQCLTVVLSRSSILCCKGQGRDNGANWKGKAIVPGKKKKSNLSLIIRLCS